MRRGKVSDREETLAARIGAIRIGLVAVLFAVPPVFLACWASRLGMLRR